MSGVVLVLPVVVVALVFRLLGSEEVVPLWCHRPGPWFRPCLQLMSCYVFRYLFVSGDEEDGRPDASMESLLWGRRKKRLHFGLLIWRSWRVPRRSSWSYGHHEVEAGRGVEFSVLSCGCSVNDVPAISLMAAGGGGRRATAKKPEKNQRGKTRGGGY